MKALLHNKFAPLTFTMGFIESPFDELAQAFIQWCDQIDQKFGLHSQYTSLTASLVESLMTLDPLSTPSDRYLLTATRSGWTAIFANGLRVNDIFSPVSYLPTVLRCRGLEIACVPDRSKISDNDGIQVYGAVKFTIYGPHNNTDWLNRIRSVAIWNDVSGWEFRAEGEIQPYEQTEKYRRRRIIDRFTSEMLESYCAALGIDLFNPDFYGKDGLLIHTSGQRLRGLTMSLAEARTHVHI